MRVFHPLFQDKLPPKPLLAVHLNTYGGRFLLAPTQEGLLQLVRFRLREGEEAIDSCEFQTFRIVPDWPDQTLLKRMDRLRMQELVSEFQRNVAGLLYLSGHYEVAVPPLLTEKDGEVYVEGELRSERWWEDLYLTLVKRSNPEHYLSLHPPKERPREKVGSATHCAVSGWSGGIQIYRMEEDPNLSNVLLTFRSDPDPEMYERVYQLRKEWRDQFERSRTARAEQFEARKAHTRREEKAKIEKQFAFLLEGIHADKSETPPQDPDL